MTVKYLRNTDAGAPQLSAGSSPSSIVNWVRKWLPSLGWTEVYWNGFIYAAVFRNGPGTKYVRFDNQQAYCTVQMMKTWDEANPNVPGNESIPTTITDCKINKIGVNEVPNYRIVGDDRTVYIQVSSPTNSADAAVYAFGDFDSVDPNNEYNYFVSAQLEVSQAYNDSFGYTNNHNKSRVAARDFTGNPGSVSGIMFPAANRMVSGGTDNPKDSNRESFGEMEVWKINTNSSVGGLLGRLRGVYSIYNPYSHNGPDYTTPIGTLANMFWGGNIRGAIAVKTEGW